jgi:hypothetical protein
MSLGTNSYSSDLTRLKKAKALYNFYQSNGAAVNAGTSKLPEQGPPPLGSERQSRVVGGLTIVTAYPQAGSATQSHVIASCDTGCPSVQ